MARAIWTGAISFGLVNVPVRLYSAVEQKDVRFHEFDQKSGGFLISVGANESAVAIRKLKR